MLKVTNGSRVSIAPPASSPHADFFTARSDGDRVMCGIIACRTHAPVIDYLLIALRRLEYRGYDSVGVAVQTTGGNVVRLRTLGRTGAVEREVREWAGPGLTGVGIGHTRWATHESVTESNAHPHTDCTGRISLVHNGTIGNADRLWDALITAGHRLASSVDSEVLCHQIEDQLQLCGGLFDAVQVALTHVEGSWGLAVLEQYTADSWLPPTAPRCSSHAPVMVTSRPATSPRSLSGPTNSRSSKTVTLSI